MFKIAFGLSLVLAVLKMIDVISCSWLMVFFSVVCGCRHYRYFMRIKRAGTLPFRQK